MEMSLKRPKLSIVIPAYAEEKRIGTTLETIADFIDRDPTISKLQVEIIVVAADAGDRTKEIVKQKAHLFASLTLLEPGPRVGKGRDVRFGMLHSHGDAIIYMDADLATPVHHISSFYSAFRDGADIVVGTRNIRAHHTRKMRILVANAGNALFRIVAGFWIEDTQCGFKLFSRHAAQLCFSHLAIVGWGFDMEVLAIAKANRFKVVTKRIDDWQDMPFSTFDTSVLWNSLQSLKDLALIAQRRLTRAYLRESDDQVT